MSFKPRPIPLIKNIIERSKMRLSSQKLFLLFTVILALTSKLFCSIIKCANFHDLPNQKKNSVDKNNNILLNTLDNKVVIPENEKKNSITILPEVACHEILKYLGVSEIISLLLANKYFNKIIKQYIKIFLYGVSPKLALSEFKLNQLIHSFIISTFPGVETIRCDNAGNFFINHKKFKKSTCNSISKFTENEIKYTILAILKVLFGKSNAVAIPYNSDKMTPLHFVSKNGYTEIVKFFIENNANVDVYDLKGRTPFSYALENGHLEIFKLLIETGINFDVPDEDMRTSLSYASEKGYLEMVEILIEKGADINTADIWKYTPLIYASLSGHSAIVKALIANGANVNFFNNYRCVPLRYASEYGHEEIVKDLIEGGANVNVFDMNDRTPLSYARDNGHQNIIKILKINGASYNNMRKCQCVMN